MSRDNTKYYHALNLIGKIGPKRFKKLYQYFNTLEDFYKASEKELLRCGLEEKIVRTIIEKRDNINLDKELEKLEEKRIKLITIEDENYPKILKEIYDPPFLLYVKGELKKDDFCLAVVGTRKASSYGQETTLEIVYDLAQAGLTIVSGLALGIDTFAHQAALKAKGKTIGVLGSGLDNIFPQTNYKLAQEILEHQGALISEFPPSMPAQKYHFPIRNRIIAGLSLGVLVVEAGEKSGALITAYQALEQNREVFALPGSIYQTQSLGTNKLIQKGAHLVTKATDLLEILNLENISTFCDNKKILPETKEEEIIIKCLSRGSTNIDHLVKESQLSPAQVNATITLMEMKGLIKNLGGQNYVLRSDLMKLNH